MNFMFFLAFCMVALSKQGHSLPYWGRNKYRCMEENIDLQLVRPGLKTVQVPGEVISLPGPQPPDFQVGRLGRKAHIT